jgi:hypothetical protein
VADLEQLLDGLGHRRPRAGCAHLDAHLAGRRVVGGGDHQGAGAGVGRDDDGGVGGALLAGDRLGEAADAVAADLGPGPVGVEQVHDDIDACGGLLDRRRRAVDEPVGAEAPPPVAQRDRQGPVDRRRVVVAGVEHDEEVVAETVVLGQSHG